MNQYERQAALKSELGQALMAFLGGAIQDARDLPGKKALRAQVEELCAEHESLEPSKVENLFCEFARKAQDVGRRFDLRQQVQEITLNVVTKLKAADRLLPAEAEEEEVDVDAAAKAVQDDATIGGRAALRSVVDRFPESSQERA